MNITRQLIDALTSPLGLNVVGGLLASLVALAASWLLNIYVHRLRQWKFKRIFGPCEDPYTLVYAALALSASTPQPYTKPGGNPNARFSISNPVSISEVRAANYMATAFGRSLGGTALVRSDVDVRNTLDIDFVCFGGPLSNFKTVDCQTNTANRLATFDQAVPAQMFRNLSDGKSLAKFLPGYDYGLILKVHPAQFPNRVWLACAGLGEWGSSGSAWFLANKWNEIRKKVGAKPFAALVRVTPGQDESAEIVRILPDRRTIIALLRRFWVARP
jgi:hypothetical protein